MKGNERTGLDAQQLVLELTMCSTLIVLGFSSDEGRVRNCVYLSNLLLFDSGEFRRPREN